MKVTGPPILIGVGIALYGVYLLIRERNALSWPTVVAQVVELPPQSTFEKIGSGLWGLNIDSDHFLTWSVNGKEYRKRLKDKASANISGFKIWRKTHELGELTIRYNPKNANECFLKEDEGVWKWVLGASIVFLLIGISTSAT